MTPAAVVNAPKPAVTQRFALLTCHGNTVCMGTLQDERLHTFMLAQNLSDRQRALVFDFTSALRTGRVPEKTSLDLCLLD